MSWRVASLSLMSFYHRRGQRVFPKSGKAWDIANALVDYCLDNGVEIAYNARVSDILTLGDKVYGVKYFNKRGFERKEEAENVIIATGGVSYPGTEIGRASCRERV